MKIHQHPRMQNISVGDEVFSDGHKLFAQVEQVFPAAVCVKVGLLSLGTQLDLVLDAQLWRADDIENLSICRSCGSRDELRVMFGTGVPFRICTRCSPLTDEREDSAAA